MPDLLSLPLEQAVGQLFFIGLPGPECDAATRALLEEIQPGGVVVFARSVRAPAQLRNLLDDVRAALPIEPLISIDQEGGLVDRLRRVCAPLPSARALRQGGDAENAREQGRLTGEILRLAGCNMNFAPVLEVFNDERERLNNGLPTRVLGYSPAEVARNAGAFLDGLQSAGILGCAKHFPGIAAGAVDAHDDLPVVNLTQRELLAYDLAPYAEFFRAGAIQTVMVGHAYYPRLSSSPDAISSVLDESIVTGLLRDTMGFRGLVITDDLEMGAITRYGAIEQTAVQAFAAGEDMALICATPEIMQRSYRALLAEARAGNVSEERIKASLTRIAAVKGQLAAPLPFDAARWQALSDEIAALSRKLGFVYGR